MPGWISRHEAEVGGEGVITVQGGRVFEGKQQYVRNLEEYELDLRTASWRRITNRNWRQFSVRQEDGKWFAAQPQLLGVDDLVPSGTERASIQPREYRAARIVVEGVPVLLEVGMGSVEIVVEGSLTEGARTQLCETIRRNAEVFLKQTCVLRE
jgi:hypothetical protein